MGALSASMLDWDFVMDLAFHRVPRLRITWCLVDLTCELMLGGCRGVEPEVVGFRDKA